MQVIKNYLYNVSYQVFILLVPLITTPYLARVLGPTGVGINAFTNSNIQYFILFGSIGVGLYGNRQVAFVRDDKEELTQNFYEIFLMRIMTITLSYAAFLVFLVFSGDYQTYYLAQSLSIIAAAFDISWFFMGVEDFKVTVVRNFIVKIATLLMIFAFVKSIKDLGLYILILSLSLLIGNITLFPSLRHYIGKPKIKSLKIWKHLKPSLVLFIPQIAIQIYLVVNKTMLGYMIGVQSAGYFDQSDKMIKMILAIVTATGTVMLPHVANAFKNGEIKKTKEMLYNSFSFVSASSMPLMFGIMAIAPKFVPLFFTNKFLAVTPLMTIEAIVILVIAWSNVLGTQYLLPTNQNKEFTISVTLGAIVNILANIPLILLMGVNGTAIATVLSEIAVTGYQMIVIRDQIKIRNLFTDCWKYLLAGMSMFFVVRYIDSITKISWMFILVEVLIGAFVYLILLILLRARIIKLGKKMIFN